MTVNRELRPDRRTMPGRDPAPGRSVGGEAQPDREPAPAAPAAPAPAPEPVSRATVLWYSAVAVVLVTWFFFGWLVQEQGLIDSAGETLGTGFAVLLAISIIGTIRRSRDGRSARRQG